MLTDVGLVQPVHIAWALARVMSALAIKLTALAVKTVAKPLAKQVETFALTHPTTRQWLMRMAQGYHRLQINVTRRVEGKEGKAFVGTITDEKAMDTASKLVSETVVFSIAGVLVMWEYRKSVEKENAKKEEKIRRARQFEEEATREKLDTLRHLKSLADRMEHIESVVEELKKENHDGPKNRTAWPWSAR